jgi:hypothetical protein
VLHAHAVVDAAAAGHTVAWALQHDIEVHAWGEGGQGGTQGKYGADTMAVHVGQWYATGMRTGNDATIEPSSTSLLHVLPPPPPHTQTDAHPHRHHTQTPMHQACPPLPFTQCAMWPLW